MDREEIHAEILKVLLALRDDAKASQIRIVARLFNDLLLGGDSVAPVLVIIPDLHLLCRSGDEAYHYGFGRLDAAHRIDRAALLSSLLDALKLLQEKVDGQLGDGVFRIIQIGDFLDLWREYEREREGVEALVDRVITDHSGIWQKLRDVGADLMVGNHDDEGPDSATLRSALLARPVKVGTKRNVLITHGHLYDPVEQGAIAKLHLNEWFVERFGPAASPKSYLVDRTAGGQTNDAGGSEGASPRIIRQATDGLALPDWVNVWITLMPRDAARLAEGHELLPGALDLVRGVRSGKKSVLNSVELNSAMPELSTLVMGHSHHPRICIYRDASDPDQDLVLMDCGAWLENSQFAPGDCVPSCNLGVLCGGDARIYQIDPHPSLIGPWT
jgi:UDP-2,3-diacylglucosamine pyrophosphatase LpxH